MIGLINRIFIHDQIRVIERLAYLDRSFKLDNNGESAISNPQIETLLEEVSYCNL